MTSMTRWKGGPEQAQSARTVSVRSSAQPAAQERAVARYLKLQTLEPSARHTITTERPGDMLAGRPRLAAGRRSGHLWQERAVINGRDVDITEDEIGVAELHLR